jgi:acetyl-CoA acetyltransferase
VNPGLRGKAAILGYAELPASRLSVSPPFENTLDLCAHLAHAAIADAGVARDEVDGLITGSLRESRHFVPVTLSEYCGFELAFGDIVDLGGAGPAAMVWRAAAAIAAGMARCVLCIAPGLYDRTPAADTVRFGASSYLPGSPQAEFEIPVGLLGQNIPYAMIANRYAAVHRYDERALARLVAQQRLNAHATPGAIFESVPLTEDDVLASPMVAAPLRKLEIVMPCNGGAAVLVADAKCARRAKHRPVWLAGAGEALAAKSAHYAADLLHTPVVAAAARAFAMAGTSPADLHAAQIYDCYSITVLVTLENAGFCKAGEGLHLLRERTLTWNGDFPLNTNGGQLGYGQTGLAGGMGHIVEAARQLMARAGRRQIRPCDRVYVSGNGGIMGENVSLILEGA